MWGLAAMFVEEIVYFLNIEAHKRLDPLHG